MDLITVILIAIGLSMDAVAVAVCLGGTNARVSFYGAVTIALWFGIFQAVMPVLGWMVGVTLKELITSIDHWIAFLILLFIGVKMIYESYHNKPNVRTAGAIKLNVLFLLSIATSIDALAVGISFAFMDIEIVNPVIIIGFITFILSLIGIYLGKKAGILFAKRIEVVGGIILILIGTRILFQHIGFIF